ncbi:NAD(P)/FAD-dependent oxidoreductase [Gordonia shandongensis]|uniref:NAD(P)/FAD-dependent oxidoreductase n=1 Tax=Gordonia shandongensis TaxID=376351 RepID=UPI000401A18A|nr:FAD-dependent oxidoreductase [Gordonia shandongensis]
MAGRRSRDAGVVVVGASLAGLRAVQAARRGGWDGPVTLVGAEPHLPYDRPPLSKGFLTDSAPVTYHATEAQLDELDVRFRAGVRAERLDTGRRRLLLGDGTEIDYRRLIVATGATPRTTPAVPTGRGVHVLRTVDDADALRADLAAGARVVVVGGGVIGAETASAAVRLGGQATIVESAAVPLVRAVGATVGRALAGLHARNGVELTSGVGVVGCLGTDRVTGVRLTDGRTLPADVVVIGVGAAPATSWLAGSGIAVHADGGVVADAHLRSSDPDVFAAGDVAHWPNAAMGGHSVRLENWTNASDQGTRAGTNAVSAERSVPYQTVPYFWSDWYGHRIQCVGDATSCAPVFVRGGPDEDSFLALFRSADRLIGAVGLDQQRVIMKLRRRIGERIGWREALEFIEPSLVKEYA